MTTMIHTLQGDCRDTLKTIPSGTVHCCVTSPPYWGLRSYLPKDHPDKAREIGQEKTPEAFVETLVGVFREVRRCLHDSGTLFLNCGDSYAGSGKGQGPNGACDPKQPKLNGMKVSIPDVPDGLKPKDLCLIPWRLALALQSDGWWVRSVICWHKKSCMPESVTDRPTNSWEPIFLLAKSARYFYDHVAVMEKAEYGEQHANKATSWGTNRKHPNKDNVADYAFAGDNHTTSKLPDGTHGRNQRNVWSLGPEPYSDTSKTVVWNRVVEGALSGDMRRIVLPDSQADGGLFDLLATVLDDALAGFSPNHIVDKCRHLSLEPRPGFAPIETLRDYRIGDESLDSLLLHSWPSAISRSSESRKTGLYVSTNISCMPSAERTRRIAHILGKRGLSAQYLDSLVNNTWPDEMDARSMEGTLYRTGDIVSFSCEPVYRKASKMQSHFAVFPTEIPRRAILAGTSARGCCPKCFAPWERVTEPDEERKNQLGKGYHDHSHDKTDGMSQDKKMPQPQGRYVTVGWQPSCECGESATIPSTVLDPFGGSGTTGAVALELGRKAILCELNPHYLPLIEKRTDVTMGLNLA